MKINNSKYFTNNFNLSNLQNNQKKDDLIFINQIYKRFMFSISNVRNLKKSGDIITVSNESIIKINNNISITSKLKSLDLAKSNKVYIENEQVLNTNTTTTVAIKNVISGVMQPMKVNRTLATYGKIDNNYSIKLEESMLETSFLNLKNVIIEEVNIAFKKKLISKEQLFVTLKRMNAIDLSYRHSTITDIIEEDDTYVTIIYHVITTNKNIVDYGGPNKYTPLFLYHDNIKNKDFYSIPLTYKQKLRRTDYFEYFVLKNNKSFKNDSIELQRELATSLKKITEVTKFKLLDVNKNCLDLIYSEINPYEEFPDSIYGDSITS